MTQKMLTVKILLALCTTLQSNFYNFFFNYVHEYFKIYNFLQIKFPNYLIVLIRVAKKPGILQFRQKKPGIL